MMQLFFQNFNSLKICSLLSQKDVYFVPLLKVKINLYLDIMYYLVKGLIP